MEKFMPRGSMGEHFSRVWLAIALLFLVCLFALKEYKDATRVHTHLYWQTDDNTRRIKLLEE